MVILNALEASVAHPTAEQVFELISEVNPSISLATVYKTLDSFVQAGILRKFIDQKGVMRFDAMLDAHSHLYCKETHEIRDYRNEAFEQILKNFISENNFENFEIDEISVVFKGYKKTETII
ncbi:Fur family transcriptional regulator, peroxide stress response regulator [Belliella buryatensis]|uniref:Fur family transcriptional regulator, peroxide stress response regulator n=2 Tax=Belliella buryatensis TaxID=1500549 RepID=A0A239AZU4_9BACT|nr:Fur family transcriptional regulator, peroxide stress response regulator [Belliella buryatensis]